MKGAMEKWFEAHLDESMVYGLTVLCVFLGGYVLRGERPELGLIPLIATLVVAVLVCLLVEVLTGRADTPEKLKAKAKALPKRLLISGLAGLASSSVIPAAIKGILAPLGIDL
jgi:uncharacterized membrane protein YraQ (UPF0718 family)